MRIPTYADVQQAARRLRGTANRTPVMTSRTVDEALHARVFFKCENFQRMGAFKFRGAFNALSALSPAARERGVVAFSSGNHAQAVALAARLLGIGATIVMPSDAPTSKVEATRGYGGGIVSYDRYREDREKIARRLADERGSAVIPPYDDPEIIAGQGTAAAELIEEAGPLDSLFVCLGGGGLLGGSALAAKALVPAAPYTESSRRPGTTASNRFARAPSCTFPFPPRSRTVRKRRRWDAAPSKSSGAR